MSKGGRQNLKSGEYTGISDEELEKRYKDPNTPKKEKLKIKKNKRREKHDIVVKRNRK